MKRKTSITTWFVTAGTLISVGFSVTFILGTVSSVSQGRIPFDTAVKGCTFIIGLIFFLFLTLSFILGKLMESMLRSLRKIWPTKPT